MLIISITIRQTPIEFAKVPLTSHYIYNCNKAKEE